VALVNPRAEFLEPVRLQESIVAPGPRRIPSISAFFAGATIEFIHGSVIPFVDLRPAMYLGALGGRG
jgi:hypothetical protein